MSSRLQKLTELQMHLEHARRLLDELTMETYKEEARQKEVEEIENQRGILLHPMVKLVCEVIPEVRTPPPAAAAAAAVTPQRPVIHPRLWPRRQEVQQVFTIPQTEEWDSEATQAPFALQVRAINWENDWSRRCVCGARPGRCQH
jgi:hypothetical protein